MRVTMRVNQIRGFKQRFIAKQFIWVAFGDEAPLLKNKCVIRNLLDNVLIVCGRYDRSGSIAPTDQKINQPALTLWVERRRRFVEQ